MSDDQWATFIEDLNDRTNLPAIQKVYQDAYDRYVASADGTATDSAAASSEADSQ